MSETNFWRGKRVFITGHTGFKGSWLCLWLHNLGAIVKGYSLEPPTEINLFSCFEKYISMESVIGDIRDIDNLKAELINFSPDIVIHLAAQALVRQSYQDPVETYSTNIMGTVNLFEATKAASSVKAVLNITTDKCYQNNEWHWGYRENEPLGGEDPYSSSKACSELITASYNHSYFRHGSNNSPQINVATARAGNVIGGGDWANDRLMTDIINALMKGESITLRNPGATRPWQHVFDAIAGYLLLIEKLYIQGSNYNGAWNFGPNNTGEKSVEWLLNKMNKTWGGKVKHEMTSESQPHEASYLRLDSTKANSLLNWHPKWSLETAIEDIVSWYKNWDLYHNDDEKIFQHSKLSLMNYIAHRNN